MGCGTSAPVTSPGAELQATGAGGSLIMAVHGAPKPQARGAPPPGEDALEATKGGSYVIGRKLDDTWEPGAPILRPENTAQTAFSYTDVPDGTVLRISYGCISEQGRSARPPHKANQDSFLALGGVGGNSALALFGVFDGHGPRGEDAAHYCRVNLPDVATRHPRFTASPEEALAKSFEALHRKFVSPQ